MESTDLVAYAQGDTWVLPKPIWQNLAAHINDQNITVTVQTPNGGATSVNFQIAPVGAGGSMVFWSMDPDAVGKDLGTVTNLTTIKNDSFLDGFTVGDDSTLFQASGTPALSITDVKQQVAKQNGSTQHVPLHRLPRGNAGRKLRRVRRRLAVGRRVCQHPGEHQGGVHPHVPRCELYELEHLHRIAHLPPVPLDGRDGLLAGSLVGGRPDRHRRRADADQRSDDALGDRRLSNGQSRLGRHRVLGDHD